MQNLATVTAIRTGLAYTQIREVSLNNCRVYLSTNAVADGGPPNGLESTSIVVLKLAGIQVNLWWDNAQLPLNVQYNE